MKAGYTQRLACGLLLAYLLAALGAAMGWWATEWRMQVVGQEHAAASAEQWFGRDHLGRSVAAQLLQATVTALQVGIGAAAAAVTLGCTLGIWAAWQGAWADRFVLWLSSVVSAIPGILLVLVIAAVLQPGPLAIVIAYAAVGWVGIYRLTRSLAQSLKRESFVQASQAMGAPAVHSVWRHIVPHLRGICAVQFGLAFVAAIQVEAVLSFLGLGLLDQASWGRMIAESLTWDLPRGHWPRIVGATVSLAGLAWSVQWLAQNRASQSSSQDD